MSNHESKPGLVSASGAPIESTPEKKVVTLKKKETLEAAPAIIEIANVDIRSHYHEKYDMKLNEFDQRTKFDSDVFTVNSAILMDSFKRFNTPFQNIDRFIEHMNPDKPYNITRWIPRPGKILLFGIGSASPFLLSGLYKKDNMPAGVSTKVEFFVCGVFHVEFNWMFGMKCNYQTTTSIVQQQLNGVLDPMSGPRLNEFYISIKDELRNAKREQEELSKKVPDFEYELVPVRTIALVDDMEVTALYW